MTVFLLYFTDDIVFLQGTTDKLYESVMAKQQWLSSHDRTMYFIRRTETIHDVVAERFYRGDVDMAQTDTVTKFFSNLMQSVVGSNETSEMYNQYYVYVAIPDGTFHGVRAWLLSKTTNYPALLGGYAFCLCLHFVICCTLYLV